MDSTVVFKRIISAVCAVFLLAYIVYQGYMVAYEPVKVETVYEYSTYDKIETDIFVIRDEEYIQNNAVGTLVPVVEDGKRVAKNQEVAIVFANTQTASNYVKIKELEESILRYKTLASQADNYSIDVDVVDEEINSRLFAYVDAISTGNLETLKNSSCALRDKITTRQMATGKSIDFDSKILSLESELDALKQKDLNYSSITATHSGYYINGVDGYENLISYDKVMELGSNEIEAMLEIPPNQIPTNAMAKIVSNFDWYMVCNVNSNMIGNMKVGNKIEVLLPFASVSELKAEVVALNDTNSKKTALILKCNLMDSDLANLRKEKAQLAFNEYKGLKISPTAIRVNDKGEKGVYVKTGNIIRFKKANVLYSSSDVIIAENKRGAQGYVKLYDDIVVEGTDLYDGKIIS
ncbi:MAG: HlyD family efflux transporter periplasmic adaptor subunit [Acutalibacteraceae bacterium]|nr:hypothetical protein [Clostridiales bacterium]